MPRKLRLDGLQAELAGTLRQLDLAREYNDYVGTLQLKDRATEIQVEIGEISSIESPFASVALFFDGGPVFGSRGIDAEFAGKSLENFQSLISKTFAMRELGSLAERGRIPMRANANMMVTAVTHGSFGFVLEELSEQSEMHETALKNVVSEVDNILEGFGSLDESIFEGVADGIDSRTLISLRDFFREIDNSRATLRIVEDDREVILNEESVHRARLRADASEIEEDTAELSGTLLGFLPDHKRFEIVDTKLGSIYGSATQEATSQYVQAAQRGLPANAPCRAIAQVRTVRPFNREPKTIFRLLEFTDL